PTATKTSALDPHQLAPEGLGDLPRAPAASPVEEKAPEHTPAATAPKKPADIAPRLSEEELATALVEEFTHNSIPLPVRKPPLPAAGAGAGPYGSAGVPVGNPVEALAEDGGAGLRLTFPFRERVSAAAFRRGNTIWLFFDSAVPVDIAAIRALIGAKISDVQHVRTGSMQYLRIKLTRAWLTYVQSDENAWIVEIGDMLSGRSETLVLQRKLRSDKRSIIGIKLKDPGRIHWITDPEAGDRLAVVTAFAPQRSVAKPQNFVEFKALATAHGIAIRPNSDDVAVRLVIDEVIITRRRGLTLSAGNAHQYMAGQKSLAGAARVGYLDTGAWRVDDPAIFTERVHALQNAVALSDAAEQNAQRFALARTYFANNYDLEALGVLSRMETVEPGIVNDPAFNALRGAALTLAGRVEEARKSFDNHALANDPDAALWKGLLDVAEGNWEEALRHIEEGADSIYSYTPDLQARFRLAAARAALSLKRLSTAADALDALPEEPGSPALVAEANLLRGWYLESIGRTGEALEEYDLVERSGQQKAIAEAEMRRIGLLLGKGELSTEEAVARLESLQLHWRGDEIELKTMRLLAGLYVQQKRYRDAFRIAKVSVRAFPDDRLAVAIQDEMKLVFKDLYLKGKGEEMNPVESLALFYEFREMTPVGRQGDEMIRRLADRLVKFDLLDQASALLDHQVNKRLRGAARAQVATQLGMIHLMN
ncbi:MAG: hypothetical protein D6773_05455, partial [Alphaproteobacteria bacterium]